MKLASPTDSNGTWSVGILFGNLHTTEARVIWSQLLLSDALWCLGSFHRNHVVPRCAQPGVCCAHGSPEHQPLSPSGCCQRRREAASPTRRAAESIMYLYIYIYIYYIYIYDDIMKVNTSESSAFTVPPRQRFLHVSLKCWPPLLDHMLVVAVKWAPLQGSALAKKPANSANGSSIQARLRS